MSTRDKLFTILDCMTDEQLEGLYSFISSLVDFDEEPSEETLAAIKDVEEGKNLHGEFNSVDELFEDLNS